MIKDAILIKNVHILMEDGAFYGGDILIRGDKIASVSPHLSSEKIVGNLTVIDGEEGYCFPGMIDMHFHGCVNHDFCDGSQEALEEIARYEAKNGVTAICPATMTLPVEELHSILKNAVVFRDRMNAGMDADASLEDCAELVGINMEGPFISPKKKGAQDERHIMPWSLEIAEGFLQASQGLVKVIGLAPEENGVRGKTDLVENLPMFLIDLASMEGRVHFSIAHSNADYDSAMRSFEAGVDHAVHLYNAMTGLNHRNPGIVGAVRDSKHVTAELICDGIHVHPSMIRLTFDMLGKERMILISDSMRATGMPDGQYTLGGLDVKVKGKLATLCSDGSIAGSATLLPDCVRYAVKTAGIPLEDALMASTYNPAVKLGIDDRYGKIKAGHKASLVIWDRELNQRCVINRGKILVD